MNKADVSENKWSMWDARTRAQKFLFYEELQVALRNNESQKGQPIHEAVLIL